MNIYSTPWDIFITICFMNLKKNTIIRWDITSADVTFFVEIYETDSNEIVMRSWVMFKYQ